MQEELQSAKFDLAKTQAGLKLASGEADAARSQLRNVQARYASSGETLKKDCERLSRRVAELERETETQRCRWKQERETVA